MKREQLTNDKKMGIVKGRGILRCLLEFELGLALMDFVWSTASCKYLYMARNRSFPRFRLNEIQIFSFIHY
jgi:hypothetical protein